MKIDKQTDYFEDLISNADNIAILCAPLGIDSASTGVALAGYIEDTFDTNVTVIYSGDMSSFSEELFEVHEILSDFEEKTLKVVLDYSGTDIESVDYYKEDPNKLVLEIKPVQRNFDTKKIKYNFSGSNYDLIITIGVANLESLGESISASKTELEELDIVNIDNSKANQHFGKINMVSPNADSLASLLLGKLGKWKYTPNKEVSKSLLIGLSGNSS